MSHSCSLPWFMAPFAFDPQTLPCRYQRYVGEFQGRDAEGCLIKKQARGIKSFRFFPLAFRLLPIHRSIPKVCTN